MKSVVVTSNGNLSVQERTVPVPGPHEVLVRVSASPINPSDQLFTQGLYPTGRTFPAVPGFECSGLVVAAGSGESAQALLGQRVACSASGDGFWSEYAVTKAGRCFSLPVHISDEQGAMLIANPISALALMTIARKQGATAVVQTAAAGALGRMVERLGRRFGIAVINLVRRPEQVQMLRAAGAVHVLNTTEDRWQEQLRDLARNLDARLAFDAVGGELTGQVLGAMPDRSRIIVYGLLSLADCQTKVEDLVFRQKTVTGFLLGPWLADEGIALQHWQDTLFELIGGDLQSVVQKRVPLSGAATAIADYLRQTSNGKVLIVPHMQA